jgi:hypothetical protein
VNHGSRVLVVDTRMPAQPARDPARAVAGVELPLRPGTHPRLAHLRLADVAWGGPSPQRHYEQLMGALRSQFDLVVLDGPAVSSEPEGLWLASAAGAVLLVVEADRTPSLAAVQALRLIEGSGGKVLGVVLNKRRLVIRSGARLRSRRDGCGRRRERRAATRLGSHAAKPSLVLSAARAAVWPARCDEHGTIARACLSPALPASSARTWSGACGPRARGLPSWCGVRAHPDSFCWALRSSSDLRLGRVEDRRSRPAVRSTWRTRVGRGRTATRQCGEPEGTMRLTEALQGLGVKRLINSGTCEEADAAPPTPRTRHCAWCRPTGLEGRRHTWCQMLHQTTGARSTCTVPPLPAGAGLLRRSLHSRAAFPMTAGEQTREFTHVSDMVEGTAPPSP